MFFIIAMIMVVNFSFIDLYMFFSSIAVSGLFLALYRIIDILENK